MNEWKPMFNKMRRIWWAMMGRCYNKSNTGFRYYGAKGVRIEMTETEFCLWFLNNAAFADLDIVSVGRIDHSKNYALDNIEMQDINDNRREGSRRTSQSRAAAKHRAVIASRNGIDEFFPSISSAAKLLGTDKSNITRACTARANTANGYQFRYAA